MGRSWMTSRMIEQVIIVLKLNDPQLSGGLE